MSVDAITKSLVGSLLRKGLLSGSSDALLARAGNRGEELVSQGLVTDADRLEALAGLLHLDYIELPNDFAISEHLIQLVSAERIRQFAVVPIELDSSGTLKLAVAYPYDAELEDVLHRLTGKRIRLAVCESSRLREVLRFNRLNSRILESASHDLQEQKDSSADGTLRFDLDLGESDPVVRLVNQLLKDALQQRASDIHIHSSQMGLGIKYRVDGVLLPSNVSIGSRFIEQLISRIKVMAGMDIAERHIPQDGRFRVTAEMKETDMRVSVLPTALGEDAVIRLLDRSTFVSEYSAVGIRDLGLADQMTAAIEQAIREPHGLFLVTGPTGSGKTTTLYAALSDANDGLTKIVSIEDPVEYQLSGITQIPVNEKKGLTFSTGLRSILRSDPDKIMIGEIRDPQTAEIAVQAALTGHLVFSTVHANSALDVIGRLEHMGVNRFNLLGSLKFILAQRLLRRVCAECSKTHAITEKERLEFEEIGLEAPGSVPEAGTCARCSGSGYSGRFPITEFVRLDTALRQMFLDHAPLLDIENRCREQGQQSLRYMALAACRDGITTLDEVHRVIGRGWSL